MPAEGCVSTDAVSSQASLVCNCEKAAHDGSIWGTGISSEFGSRAAKPLHERCGVSAVSDGLVCTQIRTDPTYWRHLQNLGGATRTLPLPSLYPSSFTSHSPPPGSTARRHSAASSTPPKASNATNGGKGWRRMLRDIISATTLKPQS